MEAVVKEMAMWQEESVSDLICTDEFDKEHKEDDDKKLHFTIGDQEFMIAYPDTYSEPDSEHFLLVDYENLNRDYKWISTLNSYILKKNPTLIKLLKYIERKIDANKKKQKKDNLDADTFFGDEEMLIEYDIDEVKLQNNLEAHLESSSNSSMDLISRIDKDNKVPILFKGNQPGKILMTELMGLRKKYKHSNYLSIDPVDNSVFHWKLKFNNFKNPKIQDILDEVGNIYKYHYLEIDILFDSKYYPAYPPFIKVIKPHLKNRLMHRITNLKMVQFEYWSPARPMEYVIKTLHKILEEHGQIELGTDIKHTHRELNEILTSFASLCEINDDELDKTKYVKINRTAKKDSSNNNMAAGIGYSTDAVEGWNSNDYIKLKQERDIKMMSILQKIQEEVEKLSEDEYTFKMIDSSYLLQYITKMLDDSNMIEIDKHVELYKQIFNLLQFLITEKSVFLFDIQCSNKKTLYEVLHELGIEANTVQKISDASTLSNYEKEGITMDFVNMVATLGNMLQPCYDNYLETKDKEETKKREEKKLQDQIVEDEYKAVLGPLTFDLVKFSTDNYYYEKTKMCNSNTKTVKRVSKEYVSLTKTLPVCCEASVFARVDSTNSRKMRVLITGPGDTPYDSGVFMFDIFITDDYPTSCPKMQFKNHGGVRMNPNMYNCGKVCLSLLGTWRGLPGEAWNSDTSTLQQLCLSVQSQILTEHPYYNEPGYEKEYNTDKGKEESKKYNNYIRYYTMQHAVVGVIDDLDKYPEWKEVITHHFILKKDYIIKTYETWVDEAFDTTDSMQHHCKMNKTMYETMYKKMLKCLETLS